MRPVPRVGMAVRVVHLGRTEDAVLDEVLDGGRTVVVEGRRFTLRALTGEYVAEGDPYYGVRVVLGSDIRNRI